ncbi:MAG: FAD:protein FMN transferase [Spongiibacteraceae bacterium]
MRFLQLLLTLFASAAFIAGCNQSSPIRFEGETQGTTYHITVVACQPRQKFEVLQQRVEQRLAEIDRALSNYRDDSELSHFNQTGPGSWIAVGADLYAVLKASQQISAESDGAFDITIAPLIDLWGFGRHRKEGFIPSETDIAQARTAVDYRQLEIDPLQPRVKKLNALSIDINGIAQGYSVDQLANTLNELGCSDFLVEVGGELRLVGLNAERKPWRIGIEKPGDAVNGNGVASAAESAIIGSHIGITTAGDYHDYFEKDGVRYSHTIDPRTGKPIAHKLASVTVVASDATSADGWDTALEVLGPTAGFELAQKNNIAAFFITREGNNFSVRYTDRFKSYLGQ